MKEILFIGRGGQGAVTAANILVEAAMLEGKYAQGFPFFGAERRGAPVTAYARVSDKYIFRHGMFNEADVIVVLDQRLLDLDYAAQFSLKSGGALIVNTHAKKLGQVRVKLGSNHSVFVVDATGIALKNKLVIAGWPVVNTGMLGALARATGVVSKESIIKAILHYFGKTLGEPNAKACEEAFNATVRVV